MHQIVYFAPEDRFYFFDPALGAFCPCTAQKLELVASNHLMRCAQACPPLADVTPLATAFRKPAALRAVVEKAKTVLEADPLFFSGEGGQKRLIAGKIVEASAKPSYRLFVEKTLVKDPGGTVTVSEAFHRYFVYCKERQLPPLTRQEFRSLAMEVVREVFGCGLRKDVPGQNGKQQEGWQGISLCPSHTASIGLG